MSGVAKGEEGERIHPFLAWAPILRLVQRTQHVQALSDIAGSGGVPRQAAARETEARSVPAFIARIVNTEGPRP